MDDDSCVMKYIEIVPRDDVKCEPLYSVKVGVVFSFYFLYLFLEFSFIGYCF